MKKFFFAFILSVCSTFLVNAQNTIEVEINNFETDEGIALVGLYNAEDAFLKKEYKGHQATIDGDKATVEFTNIPDGTYAISVFHDEDEDGELSTNFIGIPNEAYGASNNAPSRFGPPKWKDAKFEVKNGETVKQQIDL